MTPMTPLQQAAQDLVIILLISYLPVMKLITRTRTCPSCGIKSLTKRGVFHGPIKTAASHPYRDWRCTPCDEDATLAERLLEAFI